MKKSTLKIAAVLMCLATCLTAFAACSKNHDEELLYKENGKYYYRPEVGADAYELATDDKGETLVDEQGNLLWKVTNVDGEDQTHPVSYPDFIEDGKKVSCQQFTIKIPGGWENIGNNSIMLRNDKKGLQINYSFFESETGEDAVEETAQSRCEQLEKLFAAGIKEGTVELEITDTQVSGRDAKKAVLKTKSSTGDASKDGYMETYFVDAPGGVMSFACACNAEDGGKFDFKAILDTIEFRI